jgi:hypothetical protein
MRNRLPCEGLREKFMQHNSPRKQTETALAESVSLTGTSTVLTEDLSSHMAATQNLDYPTV